MANIVFSNRLEVLTDVLGERVFAPERHPLSKRLIIVPSDAVKQFLMERWAKERGIACGVRFSVWTEAVDVLCLGGRVPTRLELSLLIEHALRTCPEECLEEYFGEKRELRLPAFCDALCAVFARYSLYGLPDLEGWQKRVWNRVFSLPWRALLDKAKGAVHFSGVDVFGFSFLPKAYVELGVRVSASFYLLSPCACFWGDASTRRERVRLRRENVPDVYLQDTNPILANLGRASRAFSAWVEDVPSSERYVDPGRESALAALQSDMLGLQTPQAYGDDGSIQVHAAATRLHEVELLRDFLVDLLQKESHLTPADVLVLAPDICDYLPYVHMVFGGCGVDYNVRGLPVASRFSALLSVVDKRFERASVLDVLPCRERELLAEWMEEAKVAWAVDAAQKGRLLQQEDPSPAGTWMWAFDRLLWGLAMLPTEAEPFPLPAVAYSEAEALGQALSLVQALCEDLTPLLENATLSLSEWMRRFRELTERYCPGEEELARAFDRLAVALEPIQEAVFPYSSMRRALAALLERRSGAFHPNRLQAVRFRSLKEGSPLPAQVVCVLGMEEGKFPRQEIPSSLCSAPPPGYAPSLACEDRLLFLEALLAARKVFYASYTRVCPRDHKEQPPSSVIQELLPFLEGAPVQHRPSSPPSPAPRVPFLNVIPLQRVQERAISVRALAKLAGNPLRFFLNETLGVYLPRAEKEDKEFVLSGRLRKRLRESSLKSPFPTLLRAAEAQGELPSGIWKETAVSKMQSEINDWQAHLASWGVSALCTVHFSSSCRRSEQVTEDLWICPPLVVPMDGGRKGVITGKLRGVAAQGYLHHGDGDLRDWLTLWPLFLVYLTVPFASSSVLFSKSGKACPLLLADPENWLGKYIGYYERCLESPSPLLPEWGRGVFAGKSAQQLSETEDPYVSWLASRSAELSTEGWLPYLNEVFAPLLSLEEG
jgi:exodeoxyribonuclease V gamma subunit